MDARDQAKRKTEASHEVHAQLKYRERGLKRSKKSAGVRHIYTHLTPNHILYDVTVPLECQNIRRFTSDGEYLITFTPCHYGISLYHFVNAAYTPATATEVSERRDFNYFFKLKYLRMLAMPDSHELNDDFCLITKDQKFMILNSSGNWDGLSRPIATIVLDVTIPLNDYAFYTVNIETGQLVDQRVFPGDYMNVMDHTCASLYEDRFAVLSTQTQTIYIFRIDESGKLHLLQSIGEFLCIEDALVAAIHGHEERNYQKLREGDIPYYTARYLEEFINVAPVDDAIENTTSPAPEIQDLHDTDATELHEPSDSDDTGFHKLFESDYTVLQDLTETDDSHYLITDDDQFTEYTEKPDAQEVLQYEGSLLSQGVRHLDSGDPREYIETIDPLALESKELLIADIEQTNGEMREIALQNINNLLEEDEESASALGENEYYYESLGSLNDYVNVVRDPAALSGFIQAMITFLFKSLVDQPGDLLGWEYFHSNYDWFASLKMTRMQLIDSEHLLIKLKSLTPEFEILLSNGQNMVETEVERAMFVIFNFSEPRIVEVFENCSTKVEELMHRTAEALCNITPKTSYNSTPGVSEIEQKYFKSKVESWSQKDNGGSHELAMRKLALNLPREPYAQPQCPYFDLSLLQFPERMIESQNWTSTTLETISFFCQGESLPRFTLDTRKHADDDTPLHSLTEIIPNPVYPFIITKKKVYFDDEIRNINFHVYA